MDTEEKVFSYSYQSQAKITKDADFSYSYKSKNKFNTANETDDKYQMPVNEQPCQWGYQPYVQKNKVIAGILGVVLGFLGIHNFYLGFCTKGVIQIILTILTLGLAGIWGFIEGILYLTGAMDTDAYGVPLKE